MIRSPTGSCLALFLLSLSGCGGDCGQGEAFTFENQLRPGGEVQVYSLRSRTLPDQVVDIHISLTGADLPCCPVSAFVAANACDYHLFANQTGFFGAGVPASYETLGQPNCPVLGEVHSWSRRSVTATRARLGTATLFVVGYRNAPLPVDYAVSVTTEPACE